MSVHVFLCACFCVHEIDSKCTHTNLVSYDFLSRGLGLVAAYYRLLNMSVKALSVPGHLISAEEFS